MRQFSYHMIIILKEESFLGGRQNRVQKKHDLSVAFRSNFF